MTKILICSDSFKGSLSSKEINFLFKTCVKESNKDMEIIDIPLADGGEGTLDSLENTLNCKRIKTIVKGPYFEEIEAEYLINDDNIAIIEISKCIGLPLVENNKNPAKTTSFGVGQLILDAIKHGAKTIYLGLGGSCTNDGGCGLASALDCKFYNEENDEFIPVGESLTKISKIDNSSTIELLKDIEIIGLTDVNNPMYGLNGASYIYAAQKGADRKMIMDLDKGLIHLSEIIRKDLNKDVSKIEGTGAAGAIGAGVLSLLEGKLESGISTILSLLKLEEEIKGTNLLISGEGRLDLQSLEGKALSGIAQIAKENNVPFYVIVGKADKFHLHKIKKELRISKIFIASQKRKTMEEIKENAKKDYIKAANKLLSHLKM